jgi:hypothetical protein
MNIRKSSSRTADWPNDRHQSGGQAVNSWMTIVCGDARDDKIHPQVVGDQLAQMAICHPPYNVKGDGHISGHGKTVPDFIMAAGEMTEAEFTQQQSLVSVGRIFSGPANRPGMT